MKILILTQYYPPETGAPQNRLHELAVRLIDAGVEIEVLTGMPNYPQMEILPAYRNKWFSSEFIQDIKVYRSFIFVSKSKGIVARLGNYFSFVFSSFLRGIVLRKKYDYILCESPPLFLGLTAVALSWLKGWKLIFNVSDLWPESAEKLGIVTNRTMLNAAYRLESWCYRNSILVTGQTRGIVRDIVHRFPKVKTYWLPNGVDVSAYDPTLFDRSWRKDNGYADSDIILLYAGILGHAQKLETILLAAARLKEHASIHFLILGEGPEREKLNDLATQHGLTNVRFMRGVPKSEMGSILSSADAAIIPLRKLDLFLGAIPSKVFETLAMEKPIFLGVDGEARELFITEGNAGWYFEPENEIALAQEIERVCSNPALLTEAGKNGRAYVQQKFNRNDIAKALIQELKHLNAL